MKRALLVAVVCSLPSTALADRVPPPPSDCPRGSIGETSHAGPHCAPSTCAAPSECPAEYPACVEVALCVESQTYTPGGIGSTGETATRDVARGPCVDGQCPGGGECRTARRCVEGEGERREPEAAPAEAPATEAPATEPAEAPDEDDGGGGCRVAPRRSSGVPVVGLALAAIGLATRRRR